MNKKVIILPLVGILAAVLLVTSARGAASVPNTWEEMRTLVANIWNSLDYLIVRDYTNNVNMVYHNHAGYKGSIGQIPTAGLADGAVTATKLSSAARTQIQSLYLGAVGATEFFYKPIFIAPRNGTLTSASFTVDGTVTRNDTNYSEIIIGRWANQSSYSNSKTFNTSYTHTENNGMPINLQMVEALRIESSGFLTTGFLQTDTIWIYKTYEGTGVALPGFIVTLEYTLNE